MIILLFASAVITSIVPLTAVALESTLGLAIPTTESVKVSFLVKLLSRVTVSFWLAAEQGVVIVLELANVSKHYNERSYLVSADG